MKELNDLSLEIVSGGVILITQEANDVNEGNVSGCIHFHDGVRYIAVDDSNRPLNQRQCSPSFNGLLQALKYANERGWSTEAIDLRNK